MAILRHVAVVGGGTMGQGIAHVLAASAIDVILLDVSPERIEGVRHEIAAKLDAEIAKWGITEADKRAVLARIKFTCEEADIREADMAIEAVPEKLELKRQVMAHIEKVMGPGPVKVTHTATLSVSEITQGLERPDRTIGMHFLPPVHRVPLVEIVRGLATSDVTFQELKALVDVLGKTPVEVNEYPGYITTRGIIPLLNEAMYMVMEGVASAKDVDVALKLGFGFESGPLSMADRIGLDQVLLWMESLHGELGDMKYRPCPLLRKMVRAGYLGIKNGRGFFEYPR